MSSCIWMLRSVAERSYPMFKEWWLCGRRRAERSYSMFKVRRGSREKIPLIQGKEQQLSFAGAVKRYCKRASEGRHTETIITEN